MQVHAPDGTIHLMAAELESLTLDELRQRRDAVREQEEEFSYRRRLLHAQLDLIQAAATAADQQELDAMLAEILSDGPGSASGDVRAVAVEGRDDDDALVPMPDDLVDLSDQDRAALLERLQEQEQDVSTRRRELLDELDALQEELVRRFRRDGVDARALLGEGD